MYLCESVCIHLNFTCSYTFSGNFNSFFDIISTYSFSKLPNLNKSYLPTLQMTFAGQKYRFCLKMKFFA